MKIQSLSVVVPNRSCVNHCKFCVSRMHTDRFKNQMDENLPFFDLYLNDYLKRLEFARDNGCNTVMLTGNSEPQQNRKFLTYFGMFMRMMKNPFRNIEMQTTGVMLNDGYLRFLRNHVGVNLISLSVSSFDDEHNGDIIEMDDNLRFNLSDLCKEIKRYDFSLRLSLNLTKEFDRYSNDVSKLFDKCKELGADQVTLRILYSSGNNTSEDNWIKKNSANIDLLSKLVGYVKSNGRPLGILSYGAVKYSLDGMSIVIDDDCMAKRDILEDENKVSENYKYLVLQPNCKLYSQWDDEASLIF